MHKKDKKKTKKEQEKADLELKIIILGKSEVGKTCLLLKYFGTDFQDNSITTIGIDFKTKYFKFNNEKVKIHYLDTAGQERFKAIAFNYLRNADGILLVYAFDSKDSFKLLDEWLKDIQKARGGTPIIVLGNKEDIDKKLITKEEIEEFSKKFGYKTYEVSAKTGKNVEEAFNDIAFITYNKVIENKKSGKCKKHPSITLGIVNDKHDKKCCKEQ